MNRVLCVAVHPDDETLGCGGTLLKHKAQGDEIYWLFLTGPSFSLPDGKVDERIIARKEVILSLKNFI